jgi:hypothetical protein
MVVSCSETFTWPGQRLRLLPADRIAVLAGERPYNDPVVDLWAALTNKFSAACAAGLGDAGGAASPAGAAALCFPAAAWDAGMRLSSATTGARERAQRDLMKCLEGSPALLGSRCWVFPIRDGVDPARLHWRLLLALLPAAAKGQKRKAGDGPSAVPQKPAAAPQKPAPGGKFILLDSRVPTKSEEVKALKAATLATAVAVVGALAASCGAAAEPAFAPASLALWPLEVPGSTPKQAATHDGGLAACLFMRRAASSSPALTDMKGVALLSSDPRGDPCERRRFFWQDLLQQARLAGAAVKTD